MKGGRISSISHKAEKDQVEKVYDAFFKWKDWSAKGSSEFLNWVNENLEYETVEGNKTSAFLANLAREIKAPIFKAYPEIEGIFNNWSQKYNFYTSADRFWNASKTNNPTAMATAINRAAAVFNDNKEPYFRLVEQLEKESGISLLAELSTAELQKVFPNLIRTVAGIGGAAVALKNPLVLLMLPFMTQSSAAAMTRMAGRVLPAIAPITRAVTPAADIILNQIRQRAFGGTGQTSSGLKYQIEQ
jgi:hypothetical protein